MSKDIPAVDLLVKYGADTKEPLLPTGHSFDQACEFKKTSAQGVNAEQVSTPTIPVQPKDKSLQK